MLIKKLHEEIEVPVTLLCQRFNISRSSVYRESKREDTALIELIKEIAFDKPSWRYRLIHAELRRRGIKINHKKCYRIYCSLNLKKSCKSKKRAKRMREPFSETEALYPCHVGAGDFMHERLSSGRYLRIFNVIDVYSRRVFEPLVEFSETTL